MDSIPIGRDRSDLRQIADALGVPWDAHTLSCFQILENAWLTAEYRERKARKNSTNR